MTDSYSNQRNDGGLPFLVGPRDATMGTRISLAPRLYLDTISEPAIPLPRQVCPASYVPCTWCLHRPAHCPSYVFPTLRPSLPLASPLSCDILVRAASAQFRTNFEPSL
ncbi:uncharacterized protein BJ212DRAFT_941559 [Suillus subaureus]|uniref:Uncharacterized protein n=1 Tax=Suillus subaureus TaxID=48587 RepID=A0A9P7DVJ7_9AGAM|nr:uncharacterized protein BJ212DRAFT_941559 [Suillus subaureus]KAG1804252.1 hypothetical protein BJ212DRAFT_941559 [Suillus subaureus]